MRGGRMLTGLLLVILVGGATWCLAERESEDRGEHREHDGRRRAATAPATVPAATTRPVSYTADVKPILDRFCVRCHSGEEASGGVRVDSRGAMLSKNGFRALVIPGDSARSRLIRVIVNGSMPQGRQKLTAAQVSILRGWVDQGAPSEAGAN